MLSAGALAGVYFIIVYRPQRDGLCRSVPFIFGNRIVKDGRFGKDSSSDAKEEHQQNRGKTNIHGNHEKTELNDYWT